MIEKQRFYEFGDFRIDVENKVLQRNEIVVSVTPKVFDTLNLLIENAGKLVEKDVLMDKIWHDRFVEESNITFNIKMLRKALGDDAASPTYIETVPRRGYRFIAEVREVVEKDAVENITEVGELVEKDDVKDLPLITTKKTRRKYLGAVFVGIILLVVLGFTFYYKNSRINSAQSFQQINTNRVTTSGKAFYSIISPDGKYIIQAQDEGGKQSLWIRQANESRDIEIVPSTEGQFSGLAVSPDSKSIYYTLSQDNQPDAILYQVPILGGTSKQIISNIDSGISFSADGNEFAFYRTNLSRGVSQLLIANVDGTHQRVIAERISPETFETEFGDPIWKPNERKLLAIGASSAPDAKSNLLEVDIETGVVKPFVDVQWKDIHQISWLKNSKSLLLVAFDEESNSSQIWYIDPLSGNARKVTNDLFNYRGISLTDDERTLITTQIGQVTRLWKTTDKTAAAEEILSETGNSSENEGLAWTPDNQLIFSLGQQNYDSILTLDQSGTRQLTIDTNGNRQPTVCGHGNYIVYVSNFVSTEPNALRLWKMDKDGKNPQRLTSDKNESEMYPHCSAKSDWVVYQRGWEKTTIWKVPVSGGQPNQLTKTLSFQPNVSPDGKTVAYYYLENNKWGIAVITIEDGLRKDAAGFWQVSADCAVQSKILSMGEGFLVSRDEKQVAVLYSLCAGLQGLIILNQGKVTAHYGFRNESDVRISSLDDINNNGFDEILIQSERIDERGYFRKHRIIELLPTGISELFYYQTFGQRLNVPTNMLNSLASKIYAEKAEKPQFYEEQFSNGKGSWDNNGQNIRYDSGWQQVKQMTKLENLPTAKIVEYFAITKPILSK